MNDDLSPTDQDLVAWIDSHWTVNATASQSMLSELRRIRAARSRRTDLLCIAAVAAGIVLFIGTSGTSPADHSWLASTTVADEASPVQSIDLVALRRHFLVVSP